MNYFRCTQYLLLFGLCALAVRPLILLGNDESAFFALGAVDPKEQSVFAFARRGSNRVCVITTTLPHSDTETQVFNPQRLHGDIVVRSDTWVPDGSAVAYLAERSASYDQDMPFGDVMENRLCIWRRGEPEPVAVDLRDLRGQPVNPTQIVWIDRTKLWIVGYRKDSDQFEQWTLESSTQRITPVRAIPAFNPVGTARRMWAPRIQSAGDGNFYAYEFGTGRLVRFDANKQVLHTLPADEHFFVNWETTIRGLSRSKQCIVAFRPLERRRGEFFSASLSDGKVQSLGILHSAAILSDDLSQVSFPLRDSDPPKCVLSNRTDSATIVLDSGLIVPLSRRRALFVRKSADEYSVFAIENAPHGPAHRILTTADLFDRAEATHGTTYTGGDSERDALNHLNAEGLVVRQPLYSRWLRIREGITKSQVLELLGDPLDFEQPEGPGFGHRWYYGTVVQKSLTFPEDLAFSVLFVNDKVIGKEDPFGGVFSRNGMPSKPTGIIPKQGEVFSHYPRTVDMRWYPSSGEYPLQYALEVDTLNQPGGWVTRHFDAEYPYLSIAILGMGKSRWRVRGRNLKGVGPWSEYSYFEFTK